MFVTDESSITIRASPEAIWEFAHKPENWTASNPTEHYGLQYDSADNLPHQGVSFVQKESVAGMYAELHGRFHYMKVPRLAFWSGTATYPVLGGLMKIRIPEGGVLRLEAVEDGTRFSHNVYMDFPDSWRGKLVLWFFEKRLNGRQALHDHAYRELVFFKENLEGEP
jgi:hypothetical protein